MDQSHRHCVGQHPVNVGEQERTWSLIGAGALLLSGLRHLSMGRLALGGYLAYRGATGHCPVREQLERAGLMGESQGLSDLARRLGMGSGRGSDVNPTFGGPREEVWRMQKPADVVEEASMQSFPASDPPNYNGRESD